MNHKKQPIVGKVGADKHRFLSKLPGPFAISTFAQKMSSYVGWHPVFEEAESLINDLTVVAINAKQVEQGCHH